MRGRNYHPITVCRILLTQVDTPLSSPVADRGPDYGASVPNCSYSDVTLTVDSISNLFRGKAVSEASALLDFSDCVVCGKSLLQIQWKAVNDYLSKAAIPGETLGSEKQEEELSWT